VSANFFKTAFKNVKPFLTLELYSLLTPNHILLKKKKFFFPESKQSNVTHNDDGINEEKLNTTAV